jgi:hypothetical protein
MSRGYVYVLSNPSMPGVVKIGRSAGGALHRAKCLSGTSVPTPFVVEFEILCLDAEGAEDRAHRYARKSRVATRREFFSMPVRDAVGHVIQAAWVDWDRHESSSIGAPKTYRHEESIPCPPEVAREHIRRIRSLLDGVECKAGVRNE